MNFRNIFLIILFSLFFLTGCSVQVRTEWNRSVTEIKLPEVKKLAQNNGKEIFVQLPMDKRVYEKNPKSNDVPSLNQKKSQTEGIKARAYGRKSNHYNYRLGDIILPKNESVSLLIQKTLEQAFLENGFKIIKDERDIHKKTYIVNTDILTFWSWQDSNCKHGEKHAEILTKLAISSENYDTKTKDILVKLIYKNGFDYPMSYAMAAYLEAVKKTVKIE